MPTRLEMSFVAAVLLCAAAGFLLFASAPASAHVGDLGYKWGNNTASASNADDHTPPANGWTAAIAAAVADWNNSTALNPNMQPTTNPNEHHYFDGNYGNNGWFGAANVYSGGTLCGSPGTGVTGLCNKTTVTANNAIYNLNNYYFSPWAGSYSIVYEKQGTAAHELGHAYGLSHPTCGDAALMSVSGCWYPSQPPNNGVVAHDVGHVNALGY